MKCSICGEELYHPLIKDYFGNNPYPLRTDENARCCDECNNIVTYYRIKMLGISRNEYEEIATKLNSMPFDGLVNIMAYDLTSTKA